MELMNVCFILDKNLMKIYLFGGAEMDRDHHTPQLKLIEKIIHKI